MQQRSVALFSNTASPKGVQGTSDKNEPSQVPHFKRSSIVHPLSEQVKMIIHDRPYTLPHPIWWALNHSPAVESNTIMNIFSCTTVLIYCELSHLSHKKFN